MTQSNQCLQLKERGNTFLKSKQYKQALKCYKQALVRLGQMVERDQIKTQQHMFDLVSKVKVDIEVTQLPCMKNSSLCQLKLNRYTQCIEQCDEVLEIEPDCTKTLYRKATAKLALGQLDEAETIFRRCFYLDPQQPQVQKSLSQIQLQRHQARRILQAEQRAKHSLFLRLIRFILLLLIPLNFLFAVVFGRNLPFYDSVSNYANGRPFSWKESDRKVKYK